jgi:hypothetical protein
MFGRIGEEHASATVPAAKSAAFLVSLLVNAGHHDPPIAGLAKDSVSRKRVPLTSHFGVVTGLG